MTIGSSVAGWFRRQSLARKLTAAVLVTSGAALVVASAAFGAYDYYSSRERLVAEVAMVAGVLESNSTAALEFGDARAAREVLQGAAVVDAIIAARVYDRDGRPLAQWNRPGFTVSE